jgi:hypothetical protein
MKRDRRRSGMADFVFGGPDMQNVPFGHGTVLDAIPHQAGSKPPRLGEIEDCRAVVLVGTDVVCEGRR